MIVRSGQHEVEISTECPHIRQFMMAGNVVVCPLCNEPGLCVEASYELTLDDRYSMIVIIDHSTDWLVGE